MYGYFFDKKNRHTISCMSILYKESGNDLLSRDPAVQVPLAHMSLTSEFGMGSGVTSQV